MKICTECEKRRQQQRDMNNCRKEGKEWAIEQGLDRYVLCLVIASLKEKRKRYDYCEVGDERLNVELREITTIFIN